MHILYKSSDLWLLISLLLYCPTQLARVSYCVEGENLLDMVRFTLHLPIRQNPDCNL